MNKIHTSKIIFLSILLMMSKNVSSSSFSFLCENFDEQFKTSRLRLKENLINEIISCKTIESINSSLLKFYNEFPNSINELAEAAIDNKNITVIQVLIKQGQKEIVLKILTQKPNVAQLCIDIMNFISEANK
jgi:hypothetical protein